MKNYSRCVLLCALGTAVGLGVYCVWQTESEIAQKPVAQPRMVLGPQKQKPEAFYWKQPLLHPTYPPKLVPGENEFVLKQGQ
jgi:hypothetical protein